MLIFNIFTGAFWRLSRVCSPKGFISTLAFFFVSKTDIAPLLFKLHHELEREQEKSLIKFNLPRGSLKRTLWSFESAIIVKTTIFIIKAIKNVELLKFRALGLAWLRSDEANEIADKAKRKAWNDFKARYPNADLIKFSAQVSFDDKRQATAEVYLNRSDRVQTSVLGSDRRYCDDDIKKALEIGGFRLKLTLNRRGKKEVAKRLALWGIPAVPFHENPISRLNGEVKIFVTPNQYFNTQGNSKGRVLHLLRRQKNSVWDRWNSEWVSSSRWPNFQPD